MTATGKDLRNIRIKRLVFQKDSLSPSFAIKLSHNEETKEIDQVQGYKYLGVIEVNEMKDRTVTEKLRK